MCVRVSDAWVNNPRYKSRIAIFDLHRNQINHKTCIFLRPYVTAAL